MSGVGFVNPIYKWWTDAGLPAAGYKVITYAAGTTNLQSTYSDAALTSANPNSLILANTLTLDAYGEAVLYLLPLNYKIDVQTPAGVSIAGYPRDNVIGGLWPGLLNANGTLSPAANANGVPNQINSTINKAGSGTHALFAGISFAVPTIVAGSAALTESATVNIEGPPIVGSTLYALRIASGISKFGGGQTSGGPTFWTGEINSADTGAQNNWAPVGFSTATFIRATTSAGTLALTGIAGGAAGRMICLISTGSSAITLAHNSGSSSTGNKIFTPTGGLYTIAATVGAVWLWYDMTTAVWRVLLPA